MVVEDGDLQQLNIELAYFRTDVDRESCIELLEVYQASLAAVGYRRRSSLCDSANRVLLEQ